MRSHQSRSPESPAKGHLPAIWIHEGLRLDASSRCPPSTRAIITYTNLLGLLCNMARNQEDLRSDASTLISGGWRSNRQRLDVEARPELHHRTSVAYFSFAMLLSAPWPVA